MKSEVRLIDQSMSTHRVAGRRHFFGRATALLVGMTLSGMIFIGLGASCLASTTSLTVRSPLDDSLPPPSIYAAFANVDALDPSTGDIEAIGVPVPFNVSAMLANPAHARIYLFESFGTRIAVVSTRTLQIVATIAVPQGLLTDIGVGWFSVSPSGNRIYVTDANADGVSVISTKSNSVVAFIPFPRFVVGVTVADSGHRVYVSSPNQNTIAILDPTTDQVVRTLRMGLCPKPGVIEKCEVTGLTTSPDGRYVLGASGRTGSVVAIDSTDDKIIGQTRVSSFECPSEGFIGTNAAASQVAMFISGCVRSATTFVATMPPFGVVSYQLPHERYGAANTVAFDPTGTIGYAAGGRPFDHGDLIQFTSQVFRQIDIGSPAALVFAP